MTAIPRFEDTPALLTPSPAPKPRMPKPVLSVVVPAGGMTIDHLRTLLPVRKPRTAPVQPSRYFSDDMRPPVRSRKTTVKANRVSRPGLRAEVRGTPLNRSERHDLLADELELDATRTRDDFPATWEECQRRGFAAGPCPFVRCRHHNSTEVENKKGVEKLKVTFPHLPVWEQRNTCSLQVAEDADKKRVKAKAFGQPVMSMEDVGAVLNLSSERIRHVEVRALQKMRAGLKSLEREGLV